MSESCGDWVSRPADNGHAMVTDMFSMPSYPIIVACCLSRHIKAIPRPISRQIVNFC